MIPALIYLLCALTSAICALLLYRGFRRSKSRLLLWAGLCFVGLTAENMLIFLDVIVFPDVDMSLPRRLVGLASVMLLLFGLIWESGS